MAKSGPKPRSQAERFWPKVDKNGPSPERRPDLGPCWIWTANRLPAGYGQFDNGTPNRAYAHRFAYEAVIGPIPEGLTLDHLCRVTSCVNPSHLEPVTQRENTLRGDGPAAKAIRRGTCPNGHPRSEENRVAGKTKYQCKICLREWQAARRAAGETIQRHVKEACKRGHPFVDGSYYVDRAGGRRCYACSRLVDAKRSRRRSVAVA